MRSLNFDDHPFPWHNFGGSYLSVLGEGSSSALNARQIVARQRFAGQKDRSTRLIRNSPDERLEGKLSILEWEREEKRNWKRKKKPAAMTSLAKVSKAQSRSQQQKGGETRHCIRLCSQHEKSPGPLRKQKQGNLCRFCQDIHISCVDYVKNDQSLGDFSELVCLSASASTLSERGGLYTSTPEITSSCKRNQDVSRQEADAP